MTYQAILHPYFLDRTLNWIRDYGEVLLMIRFDRCAGGKSFEFLRTDTALVRRLSELPSLACVTAFRDPQLTLRGKLDSNFVRMAKGIVTDGAEWLLIGLELSENGRYPYHRDRAGTSHDELDDRSSDFLGQLVAFGPYPPWLTDSETVVSGVVPDTSGGVNAGIY